MRYFIATLQDHATAIEADAMDKTDGDLAFYRDSNLVAMYNQAYWVSVHETDEATYLEAISEDGHDEEVH